MLRRNVELDELQKLFLKQLVAESNGLKLLKKIIQNHVLRIEVSLQKVIDLVLGAATTVWLIFVRLLNDVPMLVLGLLSYSTAPHQR